MDKRHISYNVLLIMAVVAVGIMAVCNLLLRQSSFAVTVGYALPQPAPAESQASVTGRGEPPAVPVPADTPVQTAKAEEPPETEDAPIFSVQFPLELNAATYEQLLFIPRVGNVTAQRIIQYREHLGGYSGLEQLLEIKGIGAATYQHITAYLYLEDEDVQEEDEPSEENEDFAQYEQEGQYDPD